MALKSQVTGPITLAGLMSADHRGFPGPDLLPVLVAHVTKRATDQAQRLCSLGLPVFMVIDEPALVLVDPTQAEAARLILGEVFREVRRTGAYPGIHCCATAHPAGLAAFPCDLISFDASQDIAPEDDDLRVLDDPERVISFGLVTSDPEPRSVGAAFSRWLTASALVSDPFALASRTVVTARCGLGRSNLGEAEATFHAVAAVGELVQEYAERR